MHDGHDDVKEGASGCVHLRGRRHRTALCSVHHRGRRRPLRCHGHLRRHRVLLRPRSRHGHRDLLRDVRGHPSPTTAPSRAGNVHNLAAVISTSASRGALRSSLRASCPPVRPASRPWAGDTLDGFICFPPAAEGITGESCECANCCADAHMCIDAASYGPGCAYDLCCTEYCDITDLAFTCAGPDQQCVALFEPTNYYANVGACMMP